MRKHESGEDNLNDLHVDMNKEQMNLYFAILEYEEVLLMPE